MKVLLACPILFVTNNGYGVVLDSRPLGTSKVIVLAPVCAFMIPRVYATILLFGLAIFVDILKVYLAFFGTKESSSYGNGLFSGEP